MRKFQFSLERLLAVRRLESAAAGAICEGLAGRIAGIDRRLAEASGAERIEARALRDCPDGAMLSAWPGYRDHALDVRRALFGERLRMAEALERQRAAWTAARRRERILELRREQVWAAWLAECDREEAALAEESYLARWRPAAGRAAKE